MNDGASGDRSAGVIDSIKARSLVIVDEAGVVRARLGVMSDGTCRFALLDADGFERIGLTAAHEASTIDLAPRTRFDHGTGFGCTPTTPAMAPSSPSACTSWSEAMPWPASRS